MECQAFLVDHILQQIFSGLKIIPIPVKHLFAYDLLLLVVQSVEVGMRQALFHSVSLVRIKSQYFGQQVCSYGLYVGKQFLPALPGSFRQ
jgi:hypothetical protein